MLIKSFGLFRGIIRSRFLLAIAIVFTLNVGPGASAAERLALVIGNGAYGSLGRLPNPISDANLIADALRRTGFAVTLVTDADEDRMKRAIVDFGRRLRAASADAVGLFYYAGHGVQSRGRNFLLPVKVDIRDEADLDIEAVQASWVLRQMESAGNAINVVVLDACRNNPFARSFRAVERGLARMSAPTGSFVAYATAPGDVAADGSGRNSPYSAALADAILTPGLPIEQVFKKVRIDVLSATGGQQTPWESSSLTGNFYFKGAQKTQAPVVASLPKATEAPGAETPRATPSVAAPAAEPALATLGAQSIKINISLGYRVSETICLSKNLGEVRVTVDEGAAPVTVKAGGTGTTNFKVSARPDGSGARVTVQPDGASRSIEVDLDSLSVGTRSSEYSNVKDPRNMFCGSMSAFVQVVE